MPAPPSLRASLQAAAEHLRAGRLAQAKSLCEAVLRTHPGDAVAHQLLGTVAFRSADVAAAIAHFRSAAAREPDNAAFHVNLAGALSASSQHEAAIEELRVALGLRPDLPEAHNNLASALNAVGRPREAAAAAERCLALRPGLPQALHALGNAQVSLGLLDAGIDNLRKVVAQSPKNAQALYNLGAALSKAEQLEEAALAFRHATEAREGYVPAMTGLARALRKLGRRDEALAYFDRVVAVRPDSIAARFTRCMAQLPIVYRDDADVTGTRAAYTRQLEELAARVRASAPQALAEAASAVGASTSFFLSYQGEDDRDLQRIYGEVVCAIMAAKYPRWSAPIAPEPRTAGEPLRVGIVSGYFARAHSNWKLPIQGWITGLDRRRVALRCYHTHPTDEALARQLAGSVEGLHSGPRPLEEWCAQIRRDRPDVLIFPETAMDPVAAQLAALRLAPVQCASWGHPVSSGLPTIDYFLSSDAMEPDDAQAHYTERLIRLPNLSTRYEPPARSPDTRTRGELALPEGAVLFWCCQSLYKYLPRFDEVFPRIARGVPRGVFVFIEGGTQALTATFRDRLDGAFSRHGLRASDRCIFLPRLRADDFDAVTRNVDVMLDSVGWSGCNSTLECLAHDLPVVTVPGGTMRSRHSAAILKMMGMGDCVSSSVDDYVGRAIRLGNDPEERRAVGERARANKATLYDGDEAIAALEAFLYAAHDEALARGLAREAT